MTTNTTVPAKCPECDRLTMDNQRHCKPDDRPGHAEFWAKFCLLMRCAHCGTVYGSHGHVPGKVKG